MKSTTRRQLLAAAAPLILSPTARGANDRTTFGAIGMGSRGRGLLGILPESSAPNASPCAMSMSPSARGPATPSPRMRRPTSTPQTAGAQGLDFVIIATPDHHHWPMLLDALAAGKDVYLEKPLSLNLAQSDRDGRRPSASTDRIVQIGMQRRSMPFVRKAKQAHRRRRPRHASPW